MPSCRVWLRLELPEEGVRLPGGSQQWDMLLKIFTGNLKRFISGEPLRRLIDKELGY